MCVCSFVKRNRDAAVVTFTGGAILNALFGKVLKRIIKEVNATYMCVYVYEKMCQPFSL